VMWQVSVSKTNLRLRKTQSNKPTSPPTSSNHAS